MHRELTMAANISEEPEELNFIDHWLDLTVESEISRGIKLRVAKEQANTYRNDCDGFGLDPFRYAAKRRHRKTPWVNPILIQPIPSCTKRLLQSPTSPIPRSVSTTPDPASRRHQRCPLRIAELAMPTKRKCIETWRSKAHTLPGFMVERLKQHVMDHRAVAHVPDAINCFKTGKRLPKKRKYDKMTKNGYKQTQEYLMAIRNLCAVFGHRIAQKLIKPQNVVLTSELEKISNVIFQEISGVMRKNQIIYRRDVDNKIMHKEISDKITIWIAKILEDSSEILLEEDLRVKKLNQKKMEQSEQYVTLIEGQMLGNNCEELEEEEGPVLDFLDNLVDNVFTVCVTVSDTSDEDSNDHELKLNDEYDSNQETRSSLYHTGDSTELQDTEHEILSETLDYIDIKDHIRHEIEKLVDHEIPSYDNNRDKTAKNQLSGKLEQNLDNKNRIKPSTAENIIMNNDIEKPVNELHGNAIEDKESKNTIETRLDENGTPRDNSFINKIINRLLRDDKKNIESDHSFRPQDGTGLSSDKNNPEKGVTEMQDNAKEDNFKMESTVNPFMDVHINIDIGTEKTFNKLQGDATQEKLEIENTMEQVDKNIIESVNNNVTDMALEYENNDIEKVANELQSDDASNEKTIEKVYKNSPNNFVNDDALEDKITNNEGDEVKHAIFIDNNIDIKSQLNDLIDGTNVSEEIMIEAKKPLDQRNKAVTFSRVDMVIGEKLTEQSDDSNTFSENSIKDQERSEQWRTPSEHRHIVFSAANDHLLSDADELWPDDVAFPLLKISASINKSITSLGKITEIDENLHIPPDEEIKQDKHIKHLTEKSINIVEPELKDDKSVQAEVKYATKSTDTILAYRNDIKLEQHSKIDRATQVILPLEVDVRNLKVKESPALSEFKDTGKGDHIYVEKESDMTVQPQTFIPKQKMDYKVNRIAAPSWALNQPNEQIHEIKNKKVVHDIRKWCRDLEQAYGNLDRWNCWLETSCKKIIQCKLKEEMNIIFAKPNKKDLEKEWINLKKSIDSDVVYWTKLNQRAQNKLTTYKQGQKVKL